MAAILFGLMALAWPQITILAMVILFGAYVLVDGALTIFVALRGGGGARGSLLAWGVLGVVVGILVFVWPAITALALVYVIAAWAIFTGIAEVAAAVALRKAISDEWVLGLTGVLSIAIGVAIAIFPGAGALSLVWLIGAYAIVLGVLLVVVALRLRGLHTQGQPTTA